MDNDEISKKVSMSIYLIDSVYDLISDLFYTIEDEKLDGFTDGIGCLREAKKELLDVLDHLPKNES